MKTPDTVKGHAAVSLYGETNLVRSRIKDVAANVDSMRQKCMNDPDVKASPSYNGEVVANITLAYRHLEDASMRLGKALQALDGGVSVYDKATTVGA